MQKMISLTLVTLVSLGKRFSTCMEYVRYKNQIRVYISDLTICVMLPIPSVSKLSPMLLNHNNSMLQANKVMRYILPNDTAFGRFLMKVYAV